MAHNVAILLVCTVTILLGAELFTNSIEWLGRRLDVGEGVTGSVFAAVGTALPETVIPLIAIVFGGTQSSEIGIGAILGAPFMLSTVAFFVTGLSVLVFASRRRGGVTHASPLQLHVNTRVLQRDLRYFFVIYAIAIGAAALPWHPVKVGLGILLLGTYGRYVWRTFQEEATRGDELARLHFHRRAEEPHTWRILVQVAVSLLVIIVGARFFVNAMEALALGLGTPPLVLALLITPVATELPEKFNSVLWVRGRKDTLALGNITGAMVFQSCIPVSVGLILTSWQLALPGVVSALIALGSTALVLLAIRRHRVLSPYVLLAGGLFYFAYLAFVVTTQV